MGVALEKLTMGGFLEWENAQETRHEFYRGYVFAMVGARRSHGRVVANLVHALMSALDGSPCQVFNEGMKVQVADDTILYPDVFVTCDSTDLATEMLFRSPTLVVEVLSPSTEEYDRSRKFALYRRLESLKEYVLINPESRRLESFVRRSDDLFVLHDMSESELVRLRSLEITIPMAAIFSGVDAAGA